MGGAHEHLLPNLMIAGVTHAGATRLARALGRHEEIKRPTVKRIDRYDPMRYDRPIDGSLADYDRYFANWTGQQYRLERSPTYFDGGRSLVRAVARDLPDLSVLIVLRDPAERFWAGYRDKIATGRLPRAMTYQAYVERCLALRANGAERFEGNRYFRTLSCGLYAEHLGDWLELFGQRLRVVFAEDLDRSPTAVLDGVCRWLGLEPLAARQRAAGIDVRAGAGSPQSTGLQTFDSPPSGASGRCLRTCCAPRPRSVVTWSAGSRTRRRAMRRGARAPAQTGCTSGPTATWSICCAAPATATCRTGSPAEPSWLCRTPYGCSVSVDFAVRLRELRQTLSSILEVSDLPAKRAQVAELSVQASAPDLWDDPERAQAVTSKLSHLQTEVDRLTRMSSRVDDLEVLVELAQASDDPAEAGRDPRRGRDGAGRGAEGAG